MPIYFLLLRPAGPFEVVAWRVIWALVFCVLIVTVLRAWRPLVAILRQPRLVLMMGLAAVLIYVNWQIFIVATFSGHVIETSLGYFMNPIVTVLIGVFVLHEKLSPMQWTAVGISIVAVLVIALNYGAFPWISVTLALTFAGYGFVKKQVGPRVDALSGMTLETAWLVPVAAVELVIVGFTTGVVFGSAGTGNVLLLIGVGAATAIPLLFFASAARRLPLVYMGLMQYLAPILQFLIGFAVLHEAMPPSRWIGFGLVWIALIILSVDMMRRSRAARRTAAVVA
jgi:chloramphenicol-sensitive protein RarD